MTAVNVLGGSFDNHWGIVSLRNLYLFFSKQAFTKTI